MAFPTIHSKEGAPKFYHYVAAKITLFGDFKEIAMLTKRIDLKKPRSKGLVAVCSWCRKIRDASGIWVDPGMLFFKVFGEKFTHTICEQCSNLYFPEFTRSTFESGQPVDPNECLQPPKAPMAVSRGR